MMKYWSAAKLLGFAYAYDPTKVYELDQDEATGTYYMDMYVGTKMEEVHMLIDSQANGTAIKYNQKETKRSIVHHNKRNIVENFKNCVKMSKATSPPPKKEEKLKSPDPILDLTPESSPN